MPVLPVFALVVALATHPVTPSPAASCPATSARAVGPIKYGLLRHSWAPLKRPKVDALTPADVQPVADPAVCQALDEFYAGSPFGGPGWQRAYFKTGGYYMASLYYTGATRTDVRRGQVDLFSGKLRLVARMPNPQHLRWPKKK